MALARPFAQLRSLFVSTSETPNPDVLRMAPQGLEGPLMADGTLAIASAREAARVSPLGAALFRCDGVSHVLVGTDFVAVTRRDETVAWAPLRAELLAAFAEHAASGAPVVNEGEVPAEAADTAPAPGDSETVALIKELIATRIRPTVHEDGGDIEYVSYNTADGTVRLRMLGACSSCPSAGSTLKHGVENMLRFYVPEVQRVIEHGTDEFEKFEASLKAQRG